MLLKLTNRIPPGVMRYLRVVVVLLLLAPVVIAVYRQWMQVREVLSHPDWLRLGTGMVVLVAAQPLLGFISWIILRGLRQVFPYLRISALYFLSQAAKYLPGGIWAFPGRVVAYQAIGVEKLAAWVSLVQEVAALFLGAASLGLAGLLTDMPIPAWVRAVTAAGIGACVLAIAAAQLPVTYRIVARTGLMRGELAQAFQSQSYRFSAGHFTAAYLASLVFWFLVGVGFRELAAGIVPGAGALNPQQSASLFALAWCAGFVVVVAPAGLGIREAVLTALLGSHLSSAEALSAALAARLWWTLGEAGFIGLALVWMSGRLNLKEKPSN